MEPSGSGGNGNNGTNAAACSAESGTEACACGPGCACSTASGGRHIKTVVCLIAVLAIAGILVYKASRAGDNTSNNMAAKDGAAFAFAQPSPDASPGAEQIPTTAPTDQKIGDNLASLGALNTVALGQDAVFVFVPAPKNALADGKTNAAVLAAQRTLQSNQIKLGLYTLPTSSPEYAAISAQVQTPAILVACKGKGMAAVSGDVTEARLLQAYVATSQAGGCGPSGCGPSSPACK